MKTHSTTPSPKQARAAAQIAYLKGIQSLKICGGLTEADRRFLHSQRPSGIDAEGRIVLEFASAADVAAAGASPALNRIARQLRGDRLATGLDRKVAAPPRGNGKNGAHRSGPPKQKVLYLPTFLTSVTLPHSPSPLGAWPGPQRPPRTEAGRDLLPAAAVASATCGKGREAPSS